MKLPEDEQLASTQQATAAIAARPPRPNATRPRRIDPLSTRDATKPAPDLCPARDDCMARDCDPPNVPGGSPSRSTILRNDRGVNRGRSRMVNEGQKRRRNQ